MTFLWQILLAQALFLSGYMVGGHIFVLLRDTAATTIAYDFDLVCEASLLTYGIVAIANTIGLPIGKGEQTKYI